MDKTNILAGKELRVKRRELIEKMKQKENESQDIRTRN